MEIQDFKNYIDDPVKMQEEDFEKIQSLLEKYPFFHTANLLFVKAAHNINHESYKTAINRVSASVPNREMLHELITLKEIKIIPTEKKKDKTEESQTRKDIRERIQKRRDKRKVEKGEGLKDDGKSRHTSLIKDFFEPIFAKLRKSPDDYNVAIEREIEGTIEEDTATTVVDERERKKIEREKRMAEKRRLRAEQTTDEDKGKAKLEREKKKAERAKRMADKKRLKDESENKTEDFKKSTEDKPAVKEIEEKKKIDNKVSEKKERVVESEKVEVVKIESELIPDISDEIIIESEIPEKAETIKSKSKDVINEENSIEKNDPYTKIITIPSGDEKEDIKIKESDEITIETESKEETEIVKSTEKSETSRKKRKEKKDQVIIEEIKTETDTSGSEEEGVVIENIYDKIISSKKPKPTTGNKHSFIEITNDITGLIDEEENTEEIIEVLDEKNDDVSFHKKKDDIEIDIKSNEPKIQKEVKPDVKKSKVEEEESDIEFIVEDTNEIKFINDEIKEEKVDEEVLIDESTEESFELIDKEDETKELIEKKEDKQVIKDVDDSKIETEKAVSENSEKEQKLKKDLKEQIQIKQKAEAKAANDVFARIAAFKNKKVDESSKDITSQKETVESNDLIKKFVDDKPGMKRKEVENSENIDISEESTKFKKPVITELMASIYVNQGKYDQAIDVFEKLILKNPEKKDYFAAKIKETEKLK